MKIIETNPVSMPEARAILAKREKAGEMNYEQKLALEHLNKFTKISEKDAKKIIEEVGVILKTSPETMAQIINILPKNPDEIRMIFSREKFSLKEEEIKQILEVVSKYNK